MIRYLSAEDSSVCEEADKFRQKPLGLDNLALPFSLLAGAATVG